ERSLGYLRLNGELRKLGFEVSASTIRRSCVSTASRPRHVAPCSPGAAALLLHASTIVATDFFSVDTVFLKRLDVPFFIPLESRRILFAACTEVRTRVGSRSRRATSAGSSVELNIHHQLVEVLHQDVSSHRELGLTAVTLSRQPSLRVSRGPVGQCAGMATQRQLRTSAAGRRRYRPRGRSRGLLEGAGPVALP